MATATLLALRCSASTSDGRPIDAGLLVGRRALGAGTPRQLRERLDERRRPRPHRLPPALELLAARSSRGCARPQPETLRRACAPGSPPASTCSAACSATPPRASRWPRAPGCSTSAPCAWDRELGCELGSRTRCRRSTTRRAAGLTGDWAERWPALRDVPWFPAWGDGATLQPRRRLRRRTDARGADGRHERRAARAATRAEPPESRRARCGRYRADAGAVAARRRRCRTAAASSPGCGGSRTLPGRRRRPSAAIAAMAPDAPRADGAAAALGRARPGLERRARAATIEGLHRRHHAARPAARRARGGRAALRAVELDCRPAGRARRSSPPAAGSSNSPAWTQIVADALGPARCALSGGRRGLEPRRRRAGAARRSATRARRGDGAPLGETFEPDPERDRGPTAAALERQQALYERVAHIDSGAATPSRPSDRAMTRWVARRSARSGRAAASAAGARAPGSRGRRPRTPAPSSSA